MKKLLVALCLCFATAVGASAQAGQMAVGASIGFAPCIESGASLTNFGIGAKFQYNVTDPIRLEADLDYWTKSKGIDVVEVAVNGHYLFDIAPQIKFYPIVGLGVARQGFKATIDWDDDVADYLGESSTTVSGSSTNFTFFLGVGSEYAINDELSVSLEIKYQYIKDFNRLPIKLGLSYKF